MYTEKFICEKFYDLISIVYVLFRNYDYLCRNRV